LNIAILLFDEYKLKKAGHAAPVKWWIFLVPVYLWKRTEMLGQSALDTAACSPHARG